MILKMLFVPTCVSWIVLLGVERSSGFSIHRSPGRRSNVRFDTTSLSESRESNNEIMLTFEELIAANKEQYSKLFPTPPNRSIEYPSSIFFTHDSADIGHSQSMARNNDDNSYTRENASELLESIYNVGGGEEHEDNTVKKPIALFLPGLDGVGISGVLQTPVMTEQFDLWRMAVDPTTSNQSYLDLTNAAVDFLNSVLDATQNDRPIYLIGESFGGLLTTTVALRMQQQQQQQKECLKGIVLINPATSFDETPWSNFVPLIQVLESADENDDNILYSAVASTIFSLALADDDQWTKVTNIITNTDWTKLPSTLTDSLSIVGKNLPPSTLKHRLKTWLPVGSKLMTNNRLKSLEVPSLIIVGEQDKLLPSGQEVRRLAKLLPNSESLIFRNSGHLAMVDENVDLSKLILGSKLLFPRDEKKYDPISDWTLPTNEVIRETIESNVKPLRDATSPVFFSTDSTGKRRRGLSQLPSNDDGPVLYVANHQLLGADLGMIIAELLEERGIMARGLAHPFIFQNQNSEDSLEGTTTFIPEKENGNGNKLGQSGLFQTFGAVMVTPRNYYRLMQTGQTALLFPGGVREVFHGKDEAYTLFWPEEKVDFVRTAARFNATIVPLSAVGAADSANILVDAPDMQRWFSNNNNNNGASANENITSARYDMENADELFQPPLVIPKVVPARHYFVFGKPMSTKELDHMDKDNCKVLYDEIQKEMYRGFDDILSAREQDPYANSVKRIATERLTGKQVPTFSVDLLNREEVTETA